MPGYNFITIGPSQRKKLEFHYSPNCEQAGKPGGKGVHTFEIKCSTMRRMSTVQGNAVFTVNERVCYTFVN